MNVVRLLIWSLADSKTSIEEVREQLPALPNGGVWIANEPQERFGLVSFGGQLPDLDRLRKLIGKEPEIAEEFDVIP